MLKTVVPAYGVSDLQATSFPCNLVNLQGYFSGAADAWLQIHDTTDPGNGAIPLKSYQLQSKMPFSWKFDPNILPLSQGLYVAVSTTEATLTLSTDKADFLIDVEKYAEPLNPAAAVHSSSSDVEQVWAEAQGSQHRLYRVTVTGRTNSAASFLLVFADDSYATRPVVAIPIVYLQTDPDITCAPIDFGVDGLNPSSVVTAQSSSGPVIGPPVRKTGCTIALSSSPTSYVQVDSSATFTYYAA